MSEKLKYWIWLLYPITVVFMILVSFKMLLSTDTNKLVEANLKKKQVTEENIKIANLQKKLAYLNGINQEQYLNDMKVLLTGIPASKKPWLTLGEVNLAATRSGIVVSDFFGSLGEIKEASEAAKNSVPATFVDVNVKVLDFATVRNFFGEISKLRPLVKVLSFDWAQEKASIQIDVGWSPWPKLNSDPEGILVENTETKNVLLNKLGAMEDVDEIVAYTASASGETTLDEVSPF